MLLLSVLRSAQQRVRSRLCITQHVRRLARVKATRQPRKFHEKVGLEETAPCTGTGSHVALPTGVRRLYNNRQYNPKQHSQYSTMTDGKAPTPETYNNSDTNINKQQVFHGLGQRTSDKTHTIPTRNRLDAPRPPSPPP